MSAPPMNCADGQAHHEPESRHHKPWYHLWQPEVTRPAVDLKDPLGGALQDALVLIAFAAQSRRNFKKDRIVALTLATQVINDLRAKNTAPAAGQLAAFWGAYDDLAADTAPANAQSIRATIAFGQMRFPASLFSATGANGLIALAAFVACVALQGFWSAGRDLLTKVDAYDTEKIAMQTRIQNNEAVRRRSADKYQQILSSLCEQGKCGAIKPADKMPASLAPMPLEPFSKAEETRLRAELRMARDDHEDKVASDRELTAQLKRITDSSRELEHSIMMWRDRSSLVCRLSIVVCPFQPDESDSAPDASRRVAFTPPPDTLLASNEASLGSTKIADGLDPQRAGLSSDAFRDALQQIRVILRSIGDYWIPMSMGLLGAMTFILRSLTIQLREYAYVPRSVSISVIRVCLGAVAGVFGALLAPTSEGALKGLPPLFIPFVFGYGIEILFSLMDNVVTSFTQGDVSEARAKVLG